MIGGSIFACLLYFSCATHEAEFGKMLVSRAENLEMKGTVQPKYLKFRR